MDGPKPCKTRPLRERRGTVVPSLVQQAAPAPHHRITAVHRETPFKAPVGGKAGRTASVGAGRAQRSANLESFGRSSAMLYQSLGSWAAVTTDYLLHDRKGLKSP